MKLFFSFLFTYSFLFSSDFENIQKQKLSKYQFYISASECISSSKSLNEIFVCENILQTKLRSFNVIFKNSHSLSPVILKPKEEKSD